MHGINSDRKQGINHHTAGSAEALQRCFQNCSKISRITISSKSLKTVESKAITGINKKAVIRVPASKLTAYKKIFKTSTGYVKTMKITK